MSNSVSRIDLHVHTHFSNNAGDWLLKTLGAKESYTTPQQVYATAKSRGMDFVTITDHDTIDGALELAHLDDFFVSEEVTTYFPEDKAKIHVVCLNIDEKIHAEISYLRENIYKLCEYLNEQKVIHFVAHPFFRMGKVLTMDHFEKMLLLFKMIEVKNGGKQLVPEKLLIKIVKNLDREQIFRLANKHNMAPRGRDPWFKYMVGGSDDHGGILITSPHTVCPKAGDKAELLRHIRSGKTRASGHGGSMMAVSHQVMAVAYQYAREHKKSLPVLQSQIACKVLDNVFTAQKHPVSSIAIAAYLGFKNILHAESTLPAHKAPSLINTIMQTAANSPLLQEFIKGRVPFDHKANKAFFRIVESVCNNMLTSMCYENRGAEDKGLLVKLSEFKTLLSLVPIMAPYAIAARTEYQDRPLMRQAANSFITNNKFYRGKVAVFADSLSFKEHPLPERMLGNEMISRKQFCFTLSPKGCKSKGRAGYPVVCSLLADSNTGLELNLPSLLSVLYDMVKDDFEMIYIPSLGSMGLVGTLMGKLLNIPVVGCFPAKTVNTLFNSIQDRNQLKIMQYAVRSFYSQMDEILSGPGLGCQLLENINIPKEKIRLLSEKDWNLTVTRKPLFDLY